MRSYGRFTAVQRPQRSAWWCICICTSRERHLLNGVQYEPEYSYTNNELLVVYEYILIIRYGATFKSFAVLSLFAVYHS